MHRFSRAHWLTGALCTAWLLALPASANESDPLYGLQIQWWQWAGSFSLDANPLIDESGEFCGAGQHGQYWYLTGNAGGRTTRDCTVPRGVKLLVPVIVTFCYPEEGYDTDASCIDYVNDVLAAYRPADLTVKLDGKNQEVRDVCEIAVAAGDSVKGSVARHCRIRVRANRTLFNFVISPNTIFASDPGVWRANSIRGAWAIVDTRNLKPGKHVLKLRGEGGPGAVIPLLAVTYNLTVADPAN